MEWLSFLFLFSYFLIFLSWFFGYRRPNIHHSTQAHINKAYSIHITRYMHHRRKTQPYRLLPYFLLISFRCSVQYTVTVCIILVHVPYNNLLFFSFYYYALTPHRLNIPYIYVYLYRFLYFVCFIFFTGYAFCFSTCSMLDKSLNWVVQFFFHLNCNICIIHLTNEPNNKEYGTWHHTRDRTKDQNLYKFTRRQNEHQIPKKWRILL